MTIANKSLSFALHLHQARYLVDVRSHSLLPSVMGYCGLVMHELEPVALDTEFVFSSTSIVYSNVVEAFQLDVGFRGDVTLQAFAIPISQDHVVRLFRIMEPEVLGEFQRDFLQRKRRMHGSQVSSVANGAMGLRGEKIQVQSQKYKRLNRISGSNVVLVYLS